MLAIGLGYVPLLVAAVRLPDGSLAGLGWLRVGLWEAASYDGDMSAALQRGIWTGSRRNMIGI